MIVGGGIENALRIDQVGAVEGDEVVSLLGDTLQGVHPVMGGGTTVIVPIPGGTLMAAGRMIDTEVPRGPGKALARHHRGVGMEERLVALVAEGGEQAALFLGGLTEHGEALVGMCGEHHRIKSFPVARSRGDPCARFILNNGSNWIGNAGSTEDLQHFTEIGPRASLDGEPRVMRGDAEKAVVVEEVQERGRGEIEDPARFRGPDRGTHGNEVEVDEVGAEPVALAEGGKILLGLFIRVAQSPFGFLFQPAASDPEKAHDLCDESEEARVTEIAALGEEFVETHAVIFESGRQVLHAERHLARLGRHPEFLEEGTEMRIGDLVEDDEAGVDRDVLPLLAHRHGVGVAAGAMTALEEGEISDAAKLPGAGKAGDPGADHGYAWSGLIFHGKSVLPRGKRCRELSSNH